MARPKATSSTSHPLLRLADLRAICQNIWSQAKSGVTKPRAPLLAALLGGHGWRWGALSRAPSRGFAGSCPQNAARPVEGCCLLWGNAHQLGALCHKSSTLGCLTCTKGRRGPHFGDSPQHVPGTRTRVPPGHTPCKHATSPAPCWSAECQQRRGSLRKKTAAKTIPSHPRTHRPGAGLQPSSADINCFLPKTALRGAAPPCRSHPGPASFSAPLRLLSSLAGSPENPLQGAHTPQRGAAAAPLAPGFSVPRPHLLRVRCGGSAPVLCSLLRGHRRSSLPQGLVLLRVPLSPRVTLESHSTTAGTGQVAGS